MIQSMGEAPVVQQWMTVKEIVAKSRLSRGAIYNEINAGRLKSFRVGGTRRFTPEDVAEWQAGYHQPQMQQQVSQAG